MNQKVFLWSITVALGGFLFGFDTAVISGAEQTIQALWELGDFEHGLAMAIALYGTVVGALLGGIPADVLGRKKTLFWIAVLYLISALGSALAPEVYTFSLFRFIGGLGVGASSVVAPMYISEIAPADKRGRLVAMFQFNIVLGIVLAYLSNFFIAGIGAQAWRWMLGVEAIPAIAFLSAVLFVPRSPRWLIVRKNLLDEATAVLRTINPATVEEQLIAIQDSVKGNQQKSSLRNFFSKRFSFPIMLAVVFALFNQLSGINAIIYYGPRIFEATGLASEGSLLSQSLLGVFNMAFTMLGIFLIDRYGRKVLMYIGSVGLISMLAMVAFAFFNAPVDLSRVGNVADFMSGLSAAEQANITGAYSNVLYFLCAYIAFFAMSQGAVIWVFISEIFPNEVREYGQSLGSLTHWVLAAIVTNVFPFFLGKFGGGPIFAFFSGMMLLQLLFVWKIMPETKGRTLEELGNSLSGSGPKPVNDPEPSPIIDG